jgi:hypothetical protein
MSCFDSLDVHYHNAIEHPAESARLIHWFLGNAPSFDLDAAGGAVDPGLYRQRG